MIVIKAIKNTIKSIDEKGNTVENIVVYPERELTEQEKKSIISVDCNGETYIYLLK
jgi:hypothetical protein